MVRTPPRTKRNYTTLSLHDALPISSPTPGDAITACFGADPSNPAAGASGTAACTQIQRDPLTGGLNGDPNTTPGLFLTTSNLGRLERSEEHTSELQSLMRISYAVFCLKQKIQYLLINNVNYT